MSTAGSTPDSAHTLAQEALRRLEEQIPVLGLPRLIATDHLQGILGDARARTKDSHRVQMKSLGEKPEELAASDDMISVAGDTHITITAQPEAKTVGRAETSEPSMLKQCAGWLAAGLVGSALPIAGFFLSRWLDRPPVPAASSPVDSEYEVRFFDRDGNPIDVPPISQRRPE